MKVAIVVHGRFHAFDLARAFLERGDEVMLLAPYPSRVIRRFGLEGADLRGFWVHGLLSRLAQRAAAPGRVKPPAFEGPLHRWFGRWALSRLRNEPVDLICCWSGVSEELLLELQGGGAATLLTRGSAHIQKQAEILEAEGTRTGLRLEKPTPWMIEREKREYALASHICVLSSFALRSFRETGVDPGKLHLIPPGVPGERFRASPADVEARARRVLSGAPLTVLYVGALSLQKGMWDLLSVMRALPSSRFRFRLVGPLTPEVRPLLPEMRRRAEVAGKLPQGRLPEAYRRADIFLFPTLHDGFAETLAQACAAGLPAIASSHCAGPDLIEEGVTGWVLPPRAPESYAKRLQWCDRNREAFARMARSTLRYRHRLPSWKEAVEKMAALAANRRVSSRRPTPDRTK